MTVLTAILSGGVRAAALAGLVLCSGCGTFIEYTDGLRKSDEYSRFVRGTAQVGGFVGVIASLPVDVGVLPITAPIYLYQKKVDPDQADLSDSVLFPTFTLLGVGSLLAVPVDLVEFAVYRAWQPGNARTAEEQQELEMKLDDDTLPRYPVTPVYPPPSAKL